MRPRALVTDGLWRKSLSVIRSLGKAGYDVTVSGDSLFTTGFWSRYTGHRLRTPVGEGLLRELRRNPGAVVFPMEDATLAWVSANRARLEPYARLLLPAHERVVAALDKASTLATAGELGLPVPRTWAPTGPEELTRLVTGLEPGTFVVKPRSGRGSAGVAYAGNSWARHWENYGPLLVQERIPAEGRGLGVGALLDARGECAAVFAHERLRQYPVSGGPSTDRRSILAPRLVELSLRLLRRLEWRGVAMVEWKADPRDGQPKLMEINPRFWGSLELAVRAGVDFPLLYARAARGEQLGPPPRYREGVRCRWMIPGEILRFLSEPDREPLRLFFQGLPGLAEEWDRSDVRGLAATVVCTGVNALRPRYWRYIRRRG
ncbi:MAG TPA: ATP-grasp domain-containing protein [bacterium]